VFCTVWCLPKSYEYTNNCKDKITCCEKKEKRKEKRGKKREKTEKKNTIAKSRD
jgi:hypothetical protein